MVPLSILLDDDDGGRKANADFLHHDVEIDRKVAIMMLPLPPIFMAANNRNREAGYMMILSTKVDRQFVATGQYTAEILGYGSIQVGER